MAADDMLLFIPAMTARQPAPPTGVENLPDTGLTKCYNATDEIECPEEGLAFSGQDAQYPRNRSYTFVAGGTVVDNVTGLEWQRNTMDSRLDWDNAVRYCANLELGDEVDWRLPTVKELFTIMDLQRYDPAIDPTFGALDGWYWTGTELAENTQRAWFVDSYDGSVFHFFTYQSAYVRCVRSD